MITLANNVDAQITKKMISHINGRLVEKTPTYVVIDCNGVGYKLNISLQTYSAINSESCKAINTSINQRGCTYTVWFLYS